MRGLSTWELVALGVGAALVVYAAFVAALVLAGRGGEARALARFVPDCVALFQRLVRDPRIASWRKLALVLLVAYLSMPFDLVPDFIPVAGVLDDAIIVVLVLRLVLRGADRELLHEHLPGPDESFNALARVAYPRRGDAPGGR